jgi:hypothetical protein
MLHKEITDANFSDAEKSCLRKLLIEVGSADGMLNVLEEKFLELIVPDEDIEPAPIQELWTHSEIILTACVSMAVLGGRYPIEKARVISRIANSLGYSSKNLRALEEQVLRMIHQRGEQLPLDFQLPLPKTKKGRLPQSLQNAPFSEALFQLWKSDAELIQHTDSSIEFDDTIEDR